MSENYYMPKRCIDVVADYDDDFDDIECELNDCSYGCDERDEYKSGKNNFHIGRVGIGTRNRF